MGDRILLAGAVVAVSLPAGAATFATLDEKPDSTVVGLAIACASAFLILIAAFAICTLMSCGNDKWQRLRGRRKIPKDIYLMRKNLEKQREEQEKRRKKEMSAANSELGLIPNGTGVVAPDTDARSSYYEFLDVHESVSGTARVDMWNQRNRPYEKPYAEIGQTITLDDEYDDAVPPKSVTPTQSPPVKAASYMNKAYEPDDGEVRIEAEIVEGETLDLGPFSTSAGSNPGTAIVNRNGGPPSSRTSPSHSLPPLASQGPEDLYAVVDRSRSPSKKSTKPADEQPPAPGYLDPENIFLNKETDSSVYLF